ncbi:hypothetical protein BRADI_2g07668v3 [Brachypodium distachyon]|uniref:No apical meristem-associated C-terminal domain-containing protein n=1 Tax=Brachypodium distachyon TaxID=15368 RepID=A0A0Q3MG44_BRADI|nr:hypothetical protein BRADI_2g07668v3 [Brachypodium distachyon]
MNSDFGFVDLLSSGSAEYGAGCESFDNASNTVPSGRGRGAGGGGGGGGDDQDNDDAERGQRRLPWTEADNLRLNRQIVAFNGIWCRLKDTYASGQSDDQLMYKAYDMYKAEIKKTFTLVNLWREVHNQPKWNMMYVDNTASLNVDPINVDPEEGETRPEGSKAAKARKYGKDSTSIHIRKNV